MDDLDRHLEHTPWGLAQRLKGPLAVGDAVLRWDIGACELGSAAPHW